MCSYKSAVLAGYELCEKLDKMRPFTFILGKLIFFDLNNIYANVSAAASSETITDPFNVKVSFQGPNTGPCSLNSYITADNETWISATKVAGGKVQECHQGLCFTS